MKHSTKLAFLLIVLGLITNSAFAQFQAGEVLTAARLNDALASPAITGGSINGAPIGQSAAAAGAFTTLSTTGAAALAGLNVSSAPLFSMPLGIASGGTNSSSASGATLDNITGFAGTGFLIRTGAGAYAFQSLTNGITFGNLAQIGANTLLGNATGGTANISSISMPNCSTSSSALQWVSGGAPTCNTAINAATLGGATFAAPGDIGAGTPGTGVFTTLSASGTSSFSGKSTFIFPSITDNVSLFGETSGSQFVAGGGVDVADSSSHAGKGHSAFNFSNSPVGTGAVGPTNADFALTASVLKQNFGGSPSAGEVDGGYFVARNGGANSDTAGLLVDVGNYGTGFNAVLEGMTSAIPGGTITHQTDVQAGVVDTRTGNQYGFVASKFSGAGGTAYFAQQGGGGAGTGLWSYFLQFVNGGTTYAAIDSSGNLTLAGGISGVTNGLAAGVGYLGENQSTSATGTPLTSGTSANCASKSLSAGDWMVWGQAVFSPATSTTISSLYAGVNTTPATLPGSNQLEALVATFATGQGQVISAPISILNLSSSTTVYLVGNSTFGSSTMTCNGYINAIRYH